MRATRVAAIEKAALVGLVAGRAHRLEAERSLEELGGLAEAAGAQVVLRVLQERPKPDPSTYLGAGKIEGLAASCAETGVDVVVFDTELTPAQLREIEKIVDRKDHRPHAVDPRHLRAPRAHARRQAAGGARAIALPVAAAGGRRRGAVAARRRHWHQRPWRDETRNRPPPHSHAHPRDLRRHRAGAQASRAIARTAAQGLRAHGRTGRVHERGEDHAVQRADRCEGRGV